MYFNSTILSHLPAAVEIPQYNRSKLTAGIVHVGVGSFHRAHQAFYIDKLIAQFGINEWAICGIGILESDREMYKDLENQDFLYTLLVKHPIGKLETRIIGSIVDFIFAPENPLAAIEKLADPDIKIVTLTITEGGYNFNDTTGEFNFENLDIQWDLKNPGYPKTVFGFLAAALKFRKERTLPPFTVQSCDNVQLNGNVARKMLLSFTSQLDVELSNWIAENVTFPNSMVDRITPVTTEADKKLLSEKFGVDDSWPVVCEPFHQWVIEDDFCNGRPDWELVGAQFVMDVRPYEEMKISLLNAGHSVLGLLGALMGYKFIHETVQDDLLVKFLKAFWTDEVIPVLKEVPGIDLNAYTEKLLERFGNPNIRDTVARICSESSAKIPKFLLPTVRKQLKIGGPVKHSVLVLAAWCRYCEGHDEQGKILPVEDKMQAILKEKAIASRHDPLVFIKINSIFGDLIESERFVETYSKSINSIYKSGVFKCIEN